MRENYEKIMNKVNIKNTIMNRQRHHFISLRKYKRRQKGSTMSSNCAELRNLSNVSGMTHCVR